MKRSKRIADLENNIQDFDDDDFQYLLTGANFDHMGPLDPPYPQERAKYLWDRHGDEVIEYWTQAPETAHINDYFTEPPRGPFHRPFGWWAFEAPDGLKGDRFTDIREYLTKHDQLTETEKQLLKQ